MSEGLEPGCIELSVHFDQFSQKNTIMHSSSKSSRAGETSAHWVAAQSRLDYSAVPKKDRVLGRGRPPCVVSLPLSCWESLAVGYLGQVFTGSSEASLCWMGQSAYELDEV